MELIPYKKGSNRSFHQSANANASKLYWSDISHWIHTIPVILPTLDRLHDQEYPDLVVVHSCGQELESSCCKRKYLDSMCKWYKIARRIRVCMCPSLPVLDRGEFLRTDSPVHFPHLTASTKCAILKRSFLVCTNILTATLSIETCPIIFLKR